MNIISHDFAKAFEKNCPNVRLTRDEQLELSRLFFECWMVAMETGKAMQRDIAALAEGDKP